MFDKNYFYRKNSEVCINIQSNLNVTKNTYPFFFECGDENYAELLKKRLNDELDRAKREIAKEAWFYLNADQLTQLKKKLSAWNSKTNCWR